MCWSNEADQGKRPKMGQEDVEEWLILYSGRSKQQSENLIRSDHSIRSRVASGEVGSDLDRDTTSHAAHTILKEYYKDLNPLVLLREALGQERRPGLVQSEYLKHTIATERDLQGLDDTERQFLKQKRIHELPPRDFRWDWSCPSIHDRTQLKWRHSNQLLKLFFEHVYPHYPILDRPHFLANYLHGQCSSFLLCSIFTASVPYAPRELISKLGFSSPHAAQEEYFHRAKILHGLGCEMSELAVLQGSILLCSFAHYLDPIMDFRYWKSNATRLAFQLGVRKQWVYQSARQVF